MKQNLNRILRFAEKAAHAVETCVKKEVETLAKSGMISKTEGKQLVSAALREARRERKRVQAFITKELKRELAKAQPKVKQLLAKKKKQFASYRKKRKR